MELDTYLKQKQLNSEIHMEWPNRIKPVRGLRLSRVFDLLSEPKKNKQVPFL